jgi:hypothetical protein
MQASHWTRQQSAGRAELITRSSTALRPTACSHPGWKRTAAEPPMGEATGRNKTSCQSPICWGQEACMDT